MPVTTDRGEVMHFAGRHALSPAVRDGTPAFTGHGDQAGRCGWAAFFGAMGERGLALSIPEPETPEAAFVPAQG